MLLLSHATLTQCAITLPSCPASLIISSPRHCASPGWYHLFWRLQHSHVGGATTGSFRLHSLHRFDCIVPPNISDSDHLPTSDMQRVLSSTTTGGHSISASQNSSHLQCLFDLHSSTGYFIVPFVFMTSGWYRRRLSLVELFQLKDVSLSLVYKLNIHQRIRLFALKGIPVRILGFCLRNFLACQTITGGGGIREITLLFH